MEKTQKFARFFSENKNFPEISNLLRGRGLSMGEISARKLLYIVSIETH